jgi:hypothetical protein
MLVGRIDSVGFFKGEWKIQGLEKNAEEERISNYGLGYVSRAQLK